MWSPYSSNTIRHFTQTTSPGAAVSTFQLSKWNRELALVHLPPICTQQLMCNVDVVVSGSTALCFILRDLPHSLHWWSNDIDIYCGKSSETVVLQFIANHSYFHFPANDDQNLSTYSLPAIDKVHHLHHPTGIKMDIIVSTTNNLLLPIANFWGTLMQNYIAADHFTVAYPSSILWQIRYITPHCDHIISTQHCITKYMQRGFDIRWFIQDPTPLYCPTALCSFNDSFCLTYALNDHYFPQHGTTQHWQLSSICQCQSHSSLNHYSKLLLYATASLSHHQTNWKITSYTTLYLYLYYGSKRTVSYHGEQILGAWNA